MASERAWIFERMAKKLRYPHVFLALLVLFGLDLAIPDAIPFIDEIMLAFLSVLFGSLRKRREGQLESGETVPQLPAGNDGDEGKSS